MVFPVVTYECESWTIKKAECQRIDAFELWCGRRLVRVPWTARRSNQSILKEMNPEYSLERLMLKPKLQYFGHLMWRAVCCVLSCFSHVWLFVIPWSAACQASLSYTISQSLIKLMSRCHPTISSSVTPFPAFSLSQHQGLFPISQFFTSGGQSIGTSSSASVLPMDIQGWFPLGLTDLISLQSKGLSKVFSNTTVQKHRFFGTQPSLWSSSHIHIWVQKTP